MKYYNLWKYVHPVSSSARFSVNRASLDGYTLNIVCTMHDTKFNPPNQLFMNWRVNTLDTQFLFLRVSNVFTSQCLKIWLGWRLCACFSVQSPRSLARYHRLIFAIFAMTKYHLRDFYRRLSPPSRGVRWSMLDSTLSLPLSFLTRHLADHIVRKIGFVRSAVSLICCSECLYGFILLFSFRCSCLRFISVRGKNVLFHLIYYCISWYTSTFD
jgi:hypothetical protein